jgi:hypothetical protein
LAKHIGATVALVFIVLMVMGTLVMSTPTGKKAVAFMGEMNSDGTIQSMLSPNSMDCITGGCKMPLMGMSMFG